MIEKHIDKKIDAQNKMIVKVDWVHSPIGFSAVGYAGRRPNIAWKRLRQTPARFS